MIRRLMLAAMCSLAAFAVPAVAAPAAPSVAQPGPGKAAVKTANDAISELLKQKAPAGSPAERSLATKVTQSVRGFLDIDQLGKAALVDHWKTLKPAEQTEFLKTLRDLIEANYVNGLRANLAYTVEYDGESTDANGNLVVKTTVTTQRKGRPFRIKVDYLLVKDKDGTNYRAFDIKTDGVGLVENYRTQFNKLIKDKGFPALVELMKKKLATTTAPAKG